MQRQTADVIVVGAGSAGAVLACELSKDGSRSVLLLEAGGPDRHPFFHVPLLVGLALNSRMANWNYVTMPDEGIGGRTDWWPRGKVLGGSSTINGMMWLRGRPSDYDGWAQPGLPDWNWASALEGFKRLEQFEGEHSDMHGDDGPMRITRSDTAAVWKPLYDAFVDAGRQAGHSVTRDFNLPPFEGVGPYHSNIDRGRRASTARQFLRPARKRKNLRIITGAHVTRVIMQQMRAVGVDAQVGGVGVRYEAPEIVLCGGAINSAQLLMLSGIGPAAHLKKLGLDVVADLAGVGQNLQDHPQVVVRHDVANVKTMQWLARADRGALAMLRYAFFRDGPAAYMPGGVGFFLRSRADLDEPDIQGIFLPGAGGQRIRYPFIHPSEQTSIGLLMYQLRPESRGKLTLHSADPFMPPRIEPGYFSHPTDRPVLARAVEVAREILAQPAFSNMSIGETAPGPGTDVEQWITDTARTNFHPVGTCKMGLDADDSAVVDGRLRVHGVDGLRVADASIMPTITSGNTNAPSMLIGLRCADFMTRNIQH